MARIFFRGRRKTVRPVAGQKPWYADDRARVVQIGPQRRSSELGSPSEIASNLSRDHCASLLGNSGECRGRSTKCVDDFVLRFPDCIGIKDLGPNAICRRPSKRALSGACALACNRCRRRGVEERYAAATSRTSRCRPEGHMSRSCRRGCCRCVATLADELPPRHVRRAARHCGIGPSCCAT
jgi:hypothetical protein